MGLGNKFFELRYPLSMIRDIHMAVVVRERSLFTAGGTVQIRGRGLECKEMDGSKISVQAFRGGHKFNAQRF